MIIMSSELSLIAFFFVEASCLGISLFRLMPSILTGHCMVNHFLLILYSLLADCLNREIHLCQAVPTDWRARNTLHLSFD